MMMNLALLRKESPQTIIDYIQSHKATLLLPDQDVLNALYADRTVPLDPLVYNLGEKYLRLKNLHLPPAEKLTLDCRNSCTARYLPTAAVHPSCTASGMIDRLIPASPFCNSG